MICQWVRLYMSELEDGRLEGWKARSARRHLTRCAGCAADYEKVRIASRRLEALREVGEVPDAREELRARLASASASPRLPARRRPGHWLTALFTVPGAILAVMALLVVTQSPASALQRTLNALRRRTVHASGSLVHYQWSPRDGSVTPYPRTADYWFEAPSRFRSRIVSVQVRRLDEGPRVEDVFVDGDRGLLRADFGGTDVLVTRVDARRMQERLSPLSLFRDGPLTRAASGRESEARLSIVRRQSRLLRRISLDNVRGTKRTHWDLYVDLFQDRLVGYEVMQTRLAGGRWVKDRELSLQAFDYDRPLPAELFAIPDPPRR